MKKRTKRDKVTQDDALHKVVQGWKGWSPASEVLVNVRSVPTIFPDFDRRLRVGGLPLGRMYVVHGPTSGGKTSFLLGLIKSFLVRNHVVGYVDAEHTTPGEWIQEMLGSHSKHPLFQARRPKTYEETIDAVETLVSGVAAVRKTRDIATLLIVDSINKLVPERELKKLMKEGADAMDKGWGRYRAAMNQAWIDHLTPLIAANDVAFILVAQERKNQNANPMDEKYGKDFHVKGGAGMLYDSSLLIRVERAKWIKDGDAKDAKIIGARHRARIHKSKVEWLEGSRTDCYFNIANGHGDEEAGFHTARDLLEVATDLGVVKQSGAWLTWQRRRWQGVNRALKALQDPDVFRQVDEQTRAKFEEV